MKKLTSAIVASSLVLGLVGTVGATTPDKVQTAADRMLKLHLINGVTPGTTDLALSANLTRAQLVTILVRAFGQEGNAKYLNGAAAFPDTANHPWASGYIAMAKRIIADRTGGKEVVGMPDGTFNPDGNVTAAEAVAFLMKFVGAPKDDSLAWPDNYIQGAATAGLITAEDKAVLLGEKNSPATRGLAFYLADRTFYGYKLAEGGTTYTTFVDNVKPTVTVDAVPATTLEDKVIVTGTVTDDTVAVYVGTIDNPATIANGKFTATVNLKVGDNSILVHAVDLAGNPSEQTVKVSRTVGNAASIEAADITVAAGGTADVKAVVKDAKGNEIAGATVTAESTVGTFADGKFTAGTKAGEGKLTLKVGELTKDVKVTVTAAALAKVVPSSPSAPKGTKVTLTAQDQYGNAIASGVTYALTSAEGATTSDAFLDGTQGAFIGSKAGVYTITATQGTNTATVKIGVADTVVSKYRITTEKTVVANNASTIKVEIAAVDKYGSVVPTATGTAATANVTITAPDFTDADGKVVGPITLKDGVKTLELITATGVQGGYIATIGAAADGKSGSTDVELVEQVATSVKVSAKAKFLANNTGLSDESENFGVKVLDQTGNPVLTGAYGLSVSVTGPAKIVAGDTNVTSDDTSFTYSGSEQLIPVVSKKGESGTVTLNVTSGALTAGSATMTAQTAGVAAKIVVTPTTDLTATANAANNTTPDGVEFKFQVTDAQGVPVKSYDATGTTLTFTVDSAKVGTDSQVSVAKYDFGTTSSPSTPAGYETAQPVGDSKTVTFDGTTEIENGGGRFKVYANHLTGDLPITVASGSLTKGAVTANFTADVAYDFSFNRTGYTVAAGSPKVQFSVQLGDKATNKVAQEGVAVTLKSSTGDSGVTFDNTTVYTDATGKATFTVTVPGYAGEIFGITATATVNDAEVSHDAAVAVVNYVANSVAVDMKNPNDDLSKATSATSVTAGNDVVLTAKVKDVNGRTLGSLDNLQHFTVVIKEGAIVQDVDTLRWAFDEATGLWNTTVTPKKSGRLSVTVTSDLAPSEVSGSDAISVKAGTPTKVRVDRASDVTSIDIASKDVAGPFTIRLADQFGNAVAAPAGGVTITVDNTQAGNTYVRTSKIGEDKVELKIAAGSTGTSFYVGTTETAGTADLVLTFTATATDALGAPLTLTKDDVTLNVK